MIESIDTTLRSRFDELRRRVETSAVRVGRNSSEVRLIAVTKTHPASVLEEAIAAGARDLGENRVQEAEEKIANIKSAEGVKWHLIGHLQANKARRAVRLFDVIHSLDSIELARRLDRLCVEEQREELPILVQVDLAGETTKEGVSETDLSDLVKVIGECERLKLSGLMIIPPFFEVSESARPFFRRLRELRDELCKDGVFGKGGGELSMGMSHDFEVAIEEGATMIRVGTAIFGARKAPGS